MKGHTVIQLFDAKTGELTDEVVKDNLVTDAVNNIIKGCDILSGKFLNYSGNKYDNNSDNGAISAFSIVKRFMDFYGGIMIFNDTIDESVISPGIHEINSFIGCASIYDLEYSVDFDETRMGRLNKVESEFTENKLRFVYDFSTSACNGDIASICLTSSEGGKYGLNTYPHGFAASPRFSNTLSSGNSRSLLNTENLSFPIYGQAMFKLASDGCIYCTNKDSTNYSCIKIDFNSKIKHGLGFLDNSLDLKHGEGIEKLYDLTYPDFNIDTNSDYFILKKDLPWNSNTMTLIYRNFIAQEEEEKVYDFTNVVNKIKEIYPSFSASNIRFFSYSDNKAFALIENYTFMINLDTMDFKYLEHPGFYFDRIISLKDFYIIAKREGTGVGIFVDKDFNKITYRSISSSYASNIISIPSVNEPIFLRIMGGYSGYSSSDTKLTVDTAIDRCYLATINNQDVVLTKTPDKTMKIIYTLTEE